MKPLAFVFTLVIFNFCFLPVNIFSQTDNFKSVSINQNLLTVVDSVQINPDADFPWANSVYLSGGYGLPQGLRFELGYNFGSDLSLAATFGISDDWSTDPEEGTIGIIGKIHFLQIKTARCYFLLGYGSTFSVFGGADKYTLLNVGSKITLLNWLQLCPEVGLVFTSKHFRSSYRSSGSSTSEEDETKTRFDFNLSFEVDFRQIL